MDINCTSHKVKSEEMILCEAIEVPIEGNVVVYDNGKQIKKLIKTCYKSSLTSKTLMDRSIRLDGMVNICLIYIDENNCRQIIRTFLRHWKQRLLSEKISKEPQIR